MTTPQENMTYLAEMFRKIEAEPSKQVALAMLEEMRATLQQRGFDGVGAVYADALHMLLAIVSTKSQDSVKESS